MGLIDIFLSMFGAKAPEPPKAPVAIAQPAADEFVGPPGPCEEEKDTVPPSNPSCYRKWRMTYYVIAEQGVPGGTVPVYTDDGRIITNVSPQFFADLSLQGSGKLADGRLINVTMNRTNVKHVEYAPVLDYHEQKLKGRPVGYSGIFVKDGRVAQALTFREVTDRSDFGYGQTGGFPLKPFCTVASDIGATKMSDPRFKGKGGLVPRGTRVFIKQLKDLKLPDGSVHDGWCTATDTGGAIYGAHFDLFVGSRRLVAKVDLPHEVDVWFEGIEERVPPDYVYGLKDIPGK